jgi:hypothetical protein
MSDLVRPDDHAPRVAAWDHPLGAPNIEDARIAHALAPLAGVPVLGRVEAAYRQRLRLKSWQYMTAVSEDVFVAFAVGTAGFASNGFVYAAELPSGRVHRRFAITPLMMGTQLAPSSTRGEHRFRAPGLGIAIANRGRAFTAVIDACSDEGRSIRAELELASADTDDHLALCVPLPGGRWNYTHKFAAFSVAGHVTLDGRRFALSPDRAFGTLDFTKMFALRHAVWRWVALCGRTRRGQVIGLNLVDPTPDAPVSENALWIDGKREPLASVRLTAERDAADSPWAVQADSVDLAMRPIAHVEQKLDLPLVRQRLRHVVGAFSGHVRTRGGQVHDLDSIVGIAEDYDTWW